MAGNLLSGAVGVLAVARDVVRHAAWYLRYHVDGNPREEKQAPPTGRRRP